MTDKAGPDDTGPMSRRSFLGATATAGAGVILTGIASTSVATGQQKPGSAPTRMVPGDVPPAAFFGAADAAIPQVGLRWAFSTTVFFADRIMINSMTSPSGRGYTSVGGGEIWGPRLQGRVLPHSGADYYKTTFTTYYMLEASDGALIFIHNRGTMRRFESRPAPGQAPVPATSTDPQAPSWTRFRATPVFTAPVGPHDWMNRTVFVANSQRQDHPDHTVFTYYEVL